MTIDDQRKGNVPEHEAPGREVELIAGDNRPTVGLDPEELARMASEDLARRQLRIQIDEDSAQAGRSDSKKPSG